MSFIILKTIIVDLNYHIQVDYRAVRRIIILRVIERQRTLNKYGYSHDKQQRAVDAVLKQAEVMADY